MLSFVYRLCREFEREHGFRPNVLFINSAHLERLRGDFDNPDDLTAIRRLLGLEILLRRDSVHPQVGWIQSAARQAG